MHNNMNCNCFDEITKDMEKKFNYSEDCFEEIFTSTPLKSQIHFGCMVVFQTEQLRYKIEPNSRIYKDRKFNDIQFMFCPLCGKKTKVEDFNNYYSKFLNK